MDSSECGLQNTIAFIPEQNSISYVNNGLQLSSEPTSSIALSVKTHTEIYSVDTEEDDIPRRKRFNMYLKRYEFIKNIRSKWQKLKLKRQTRVKYERLQ
ncbi:hypothetical protein CDAR_619451 [Caerostris darwini]|uniref:Uncharacterized protein n=1 Tax=Caerostris darwini TaxID=1538125 RepID=A0AAV4TSC0_9ARAC|nr:hypothetical protein CDAR_619451 [Caerostris darwini]